MGGMEEREKASHQEGPVVSGKTYLEETSSTDLETGTAQSFCTSSPGKRTAY